LASWSGVNTIFSRPGDGNPRVIPVETGIQTHYTIVIPVEADNTIGLKLTAVVAKEARNWWIDENWCPPCRTTFLRRLRASLSRYPSLLRFTALL